MSRPPLHALQGFAAAARSGNLSRAAESMHLTVSALSHQIKALEERIGYRVFVRGSRGITLTEDGRRLWEQVAPHLQAIEHALRPRAAQREDVLTISMTPLMASAWLVPRLQDFLCRYPQLEFNLQSSEALVDFARDSAIDAALRSGHGEWPGLIAERLFGESLQPVASPALLKRLKPTLGKPCLKDLHRWPLLGDPGGYWDRWFAHFGTQAPSRYVTRFDDLDAMQRAAVAGVGIGLGRMSRAQPLIDDGTLVQPLREALNDEYAHFLVYPPRSREHAGLRAFRTWLLEQALAYREERPQGGMRNPTAERTARTARTVGRVRSNKRT
jgi:LysR family transcriptional regulator, glycine cleavage system transcriptional activator